MDICFEGVGQVAATFELEDDPIQPGMAVTLTGNATVGLGDDGDLPCGVLLGGVRAGAAAVQIGGAVETGFSGTAPEVGWQELACDGKGGVKVAAGGAKCLVLAVDEEESTAVIKL